MAYDLDFDAFQEAIATNRCVSDGNPLSQPDANGLRHCPICSFATNGNSVMNDLQGAA